MKALKFSYRQFKIIKLINNNFFFFYLNNFFKINMLERKKEDIIRYSRSRKHIEMVLDYPLKIER